MRINIFYQFRSIAMILIFFQYINGMQIKIFYSIWLNQYISKCKTNYNVIFFSNITKGILLLQKCIKNNLIIFGMIIINKIFHQLNILLFQQFVLHNIPRQIQVCRFHSITQNKKQQALAGLLFRYLGV